LDAVSLPPRTYAQVPGFYEKSLVWQPEIKVETGFLVSSCVSPEDDASGAFVADRNKPLAKVLLRGFEARAPTPTPQQFFWFCGVGSIARPPHKNFSGFVGWVVLPAHPTRIFLVLWGG